MYIFILILKAMEEAASSRSEVSSSVSEVPAAADTQSLEAKSRPSTAADFNMAEAVRVLVLYH